jgi:hypothetical protein
MFIDLKWTGTRGIPAATSDGANYQRGDRKRTLHPHLALFALTADERHGAMKNPNTRPPQMKVKEMVRDSPAGKQADSL